MGYTTEFNGRFTLNKKLPITLYDEMVAFSEADHRDEQDMPGIWCDWMPTEDRRGIEWNGSEKFYEYVEWLKYIINKFLASGGYILEGFVQYQGENSDDCGYIHVFKNTVRLSFSPDHLPAPVPEPVLVPEPVQPKVVTTFIDACPMRRINWRNNGT